MTKTRKRRTPKEGERMAVELDELDAFERWFYSVPGHERWSCLTPAYALASKAWQASAARRLKGRA